MGALTGVLTAVVLVAAGWVCIEVIRLLRQIADELRHIRKTLQEVGSEFGKISGPLDTVQKIYGVGEGLLHLRGESRAAGKPQKPE